jgi:hypothetical protein
LETEESAQAARVFISLNESDQKTAFACRRAPALARARYNSAQA